MLVTLDMFSSEYRYIVMTRNDLFVEKYDFKKGSNYEKDYKRGNDI